MDKQLVALERSKLQKVGATLAGAGEGLIDLAKNAGSAIAPAANAAFVIMTVLSAAANMRNEYPGNADQEQGMAHPASLMMLSGMLIAMEMYANGIFPQILATGAAIQNALTSPFKKKTE